MSSVQIPSIEFKDNRIQKCTFIIDKKTFNVIYSNDKYTVTNGGKSEKKDTAHVVEENDVSPSSVVVVEEPKPAASNSQASKSPAPKSAVQKPTARGKKKAETAVVTSTDMTNLANTLSLISK